jgi:signal transduction histidine kinase
VRLPRPLRTSSFRLTILYVAIISLSGLVLFAAIAWSVDHFMAQQIDTTVSNELAELQADVGSQDTAALKHAIDGLVTRAPGFYYLLQGADGAVLAGNMMAIHPRPGLRSLEWPHQTQDRHTGGGSGVRGRGVLLTDGSYLFVGVSDYQLEEVREVVTGTFAAGLAATIILAIAGGVAMSLGVLRRVENVSRASRAIMAGDLGQRMALRGTDDEFDHLGSSLNAMLDRIQALMNGLQQVSNDIAHDLRTPLTRLRQRLELAQRRETTVEGFKAALDDAITNADEILETFGALLRIAQIEAGTRRSGFGPVRLDILLTELVDAYQPVAEGTGQALTGTFDAPLSLLGDRELLTLLFANLIENAIRHCPSQATIEVQAERVGEEITAWVADNGPGIPAGYRDKVLQRFYRLEASRTTPGNGLGLSAVGAIATLHDARLVLADNGPGLRCVLHFRPTSEPEFPRQTA